MKRLAALAVIVLGLSGCAVTGQQGDPGVAFIYEGRTVTNEDIDDIYSAWVHDTRGTDVPNRSQVLTVEALREDAIRAVDDAGIELSEADATDIARNWLRFKGQDGEPSQEMVHAVHGIAAIYLVLRMDSTGEQLHNMALKAQEGLIGSPRAGDFDADAFMASVARAAQDADSQSLGDQFSYTTFQNVNGFVDPMVEYRQAPAAEKPAPTSSPSPAAN